MDLNILDVCHPSIPALILTGAQSFLSLASGNLFKWTPDTVKYDLLNNLLSFCTGRCSSFILWIFCPRPKISHFSKVPWFLLVEVVLSDFQDKDRKGDQLLPGPLPSEYTPLEPRATRTWMSSKKTEKFLLKKTSTVGSGEARCFRHQWRHHTTGKEHIWTAETRGERGANSGDLGHIWQADTSSQVTISGEGKKFLRFKLDKTPGLFLMFCFAR